MAGCEVRENCKNPSWCADCVDGSNYIPIDKSVRHPARLQREREKQDARRAWKQGAGFRRGKLANKAGARLEKETARRLDGQRVPYSGRYGGHDVAIPGLAVECKYREGGFRFLYRTLRPGGTGAPDALVVQGSRHEPPLVVLTLERFRALTGNPELKVVGDGIDGIEVPTCFG